MAQVIPFIGAAIGGAIGGTFLGVSAAAWGYFAGSLLASAIFKPPGQQGPRLEDLTIVGTDYGQAIPWVAGSPRLAPQFAWISTLREIANTQKVGKGGGSKVTTYTYECDVLLILTENVTADVVRDWVNAELIRNGLTVKDGVYGGGVTVYSGNDDQLPDPTYEAAVGAADAPAYRGRTTIVIRSLQLGNGKQMPNFEHQVSSGFIEYADTPFLAPLSLDSADIKSDPIPDSETNPGSVSFIYSNDQLVMSRTMPSSSGGIQWIASSLGSKIDNTSYPDQKLTFAIDVHGMVVSGGGTNATSNLRFRIRSLSFNNEFSYVWFVASGVPSPLTFAYGQTIGTPAYPSGYVGTFKIELDQTVPAINFYFNDELLRTEPGAPLNIDRISFEFLNSVSGPFIESVTVSRARMWVGGYDEEVTVNTSHVPMNVLIESLLDRCGYRNSEYAVSPELGGVEVHGYATGNVVSTRAHLETIRPFGIYESNCSDKLYIFPRAITPVGAIPWEDLGVSETPGAPSDPFPLQVGNEVEVPAQIAVRYRNVAADWNTGTEFSDRLVSSLVSTQTVDMPLGLMPAQAKRIADTILKDAIAGLGRAALRVGGRKHAKYEPGDILTTTAPNGTAYRFRIITKRDHIFMLEWDVALDDASALESEAITYEGYVSTQDPIRVAPTEWEVMGIPALQDADASIPGPYVAIAPSKNSDTDEWPGAVFVRARLPEAFEQVFISGDVCVIGTCQTTLGGFDGGSTVLDWTQKLRVRVRGELSSSTWDDFFADRTINAALVGHEPIRFMRADFVTTDGQFRIYDLSGLLRGQLGQEHEMDVHVASERFVLLNAAIRRMPNQTTDIGQEHQVKAVTLNLLLSDVTDEDFTEDGIALRPYSPSNVIALAQVDGSIDVSWVRRSRLVARYTDQGVFAPLGESTEAYRVKVYDGTTLVRTENVTSPSWIYGSTDIVSDGFSSNDPITITVQQLSESVGEGFAATVETTAP